MLSRLHNSHIFLYSREEWLLHQNILPACWDTPDGRVFVLYVPRVRGTEKPPFQPGDEILSIDGVPAARLRPVTLARLEPVEGNPNFGAPGSVAELTIRRGGTTTTICVPRVTRPAGFECVTAESPIAGILHLRFLTLAASDLPAERLRDLWDEASRQRALILDLRNCVGGDPAVSNTIAGLLLGPGIPLFRTIPRPASQHAEVLDVSASGVPRFRGRVAVITNANTESQPEVLAAICKEYRRAQLFGERTAGAFNGWTEAIPLPGNFARFALPYTRCVSPHARAYEGVGVVPHHALRDTVADFESRRDRALEAALRYLATDR